MNDNISKLYGALKSKGYTDIGKDEDAFRDWIGKEGNVKILYGALSKNGYEDIGNEAQFTEWVGVKPQQAMANLSRSSYQPTPEEVKQYTLQNKPDIFKPKTGSLVDRAAGIEAQEQPTFEVPNVLRGITTKETVEDLYNTVGNAYSTANQMGERMNARVDMLSKNLQDPEYQKSRTKMQLRSISDEVSSALQDLQGRVKVSNIDKYRPANLQYLPVNPVNQELMPEYTALRKAQRLVEESQNIIDEASKKGNTNFMAGLARGFWDNLNAEDYTFGADDAAQSAYLYQALDKAERGEKLSKAEETLLDAAVINMAVQSYYAQDLGKGYGAGSVTAESIPFMIEMAINPISSFGKASAKKLLGYGVKKFLGNAVKGLGKSTASGIGMAATTGLGDVLEGTTDRLAKNYKYYVDNEGNLHVDKKEDAMGMGEAFARSFTTRAIENQSEMIFNAFKGMGGFMKGVEKVLPGGVNKFFDMLSHNKVADAYRWLKNSPVFRNYLVKDVRNATQIGGIFEEYAEEVYNNLANFAIGEMSWEDVASLDKNIDTFLGLAPTQVMFGILGLGGAASMRYQTRKTLEDLQATMNEQQRKELEGLLDMGIDAKEVDVRGFIRNVMENQNYTIENKRDLIKAAYYVAQQRSIDELTEADVIDKVNAENQFIDSMTDPSTGNYAELSRNVINPQTGESEQQKGYVVGWIGEGDKRQPIFVADGMENNYANRVVLKPTEWSMDSYREMPAEQVKAVNEEMNREEAAQQAERESKYAPEVLNAQMPEGEFTMGGHLFVPSQVTSDGVIYDIFNLNEKGKPTTTIPVESRPVHIDEYRDMLQAQIDAQEAAAPVNVPSVENVGEEVNAEVNAPVNNENVQPVAEVVASEAQAEQPKQPTLEEVVATLPKTKNNEIDYKAMTPQQQYQYTSLTESPEVALEDLQADIAAGQEEIAKKQEKLSKARGGERAALRDEVRKLTQAQAELQAFYDSIAPKHEEVVNEESVEPIANTSEEAIDEPKVTEVRSEQPKVKKPKKKKSLFGQKKKDSEFTEEEMQPMNAIEFAASYLASGNIAITTESFKKETGYGEAERKKFMGMLRTPEKGGMTIEQAAEKLVSLDNEQNGHFFEGDTQAARDTIIELLGYETWGGVANLIKNNRTAERKKREEAEYAEYEAYLMEALHVTPEELELQKEYDEQNNPFPDVSEEEYFAKFAEKAEEYINYLNSYSNEQGRTDEVAGRNDSLLSEERAGDIGGNQRSERERESKEVGSESIHDSETSQESTSGSEVAPSIEETNVSRMADIEAEIIDIDGRKLEIEDELNELSDSDLLAKAALIDELSRLDELQAELQAEYSGLYNMNEESRAIIEEEGGTPLFRQKGKRTKADKKPFVERAKHWEEKTGVKIRIANNLRDVKNRSAFVQILRGSQVTGWFEESTGEVVLYMPHIASIEEVDTTFIHEVVAHKGLRGLLGERFNEFLDEVWNMMSKADQAKYLNYPGVNGDTRAAADEYIANTFETIDVTESAWSKLTELIKRFLKALGLEPNMTNADIANTIKKSYQRLLEGEGGASIVGEGTRFSAKKKASKTVLPEDISSFKGSVVSDADRAKVLNNLDNLQKVYEEKSSKRQKTFISDLSKALHLRNNGNNSNYADYVTVNGKEVTIRVSDHNVSVKDMDGAGKSNGVSIVIGRKPNKGIREFGEAHIVEYYYNNKKLENSEGNPYSEIIQSFKQTVYSGEYKDTTGLAKRQEVNKSRFRVVFHGSAADFDKFDRNFSGSGEGQAVMGAGHYVTTSEGTGRYYAEVASDMRRKVVQEGGYTYNGKVVRSRPLVDAYEALKKNEFDVDKAIESIEHRIAVIRRVKGDKANTTNAEEAIRLLNEEKANKGTLGYQEEIIEKPDRHLYEVEIPDDNGKNYFDLDKKATKKTKDEAKRRLYSALENSEEAEYWQKNRDIIEDEWRYNVNTSDATNDSVRATMEQFLAQEEVADILSDMGYVGSKSKATDGTTYIIYNDDSLEIKSNTRFRVSNRNQEIFVSNAQRAVEGIKQEKGTPQQWLAMIEKNGGLKAGEDKWLGLSDWLKGLDKKSVTKDEILEFIGQNKIVIEEVKYASGGGIETLRDKYPTFDDAFDVYESPFGVSVDIKDNKKAAEIVFDIQSKENPYAAKYEVDEYEDFVDNDAEFEIRERIEYAIKYEGATPINSTRLEYTTEGLNNKQEIALTIPTIEPWNKNDDIHFGDAGEGRAIAWIRFGETYVMEEDNFTREVTELKEPYRDVNGLDIYKTDSGNNDFIAHGKGRNGEMIYVAFVNGKQIPVAHKTLDDAKGEMNKYFKGHPIKSSKRINVLVIDEIQSKRHQEGREKGYKPNPDIYLKENGIDVVESGEFYEFYKNGELDKRFAKSVLNNNINKAKDLYVGGQLKTNIPAAPFEKNWSELAFKRMLRYAAENGFDKVAWTTGAQQAERYSLSNVVDSISISKSKKEDGKYHVTSWDKETMPIGVASGNKTPEELKELFGKEIAQSLIEGVDNLEEGSDTFVLEGADLEVGGEGMKGFYDKMLPSFVNKYVKKWGTKVQDIELPHVEEAGRIMHSVDVTDAMKESVMEGQTMFRISEKGKQIQAEVDKFTSKYNSKPVVVLDSSMTDDEIERMMEGYSAKEIRDRFGKKSKGGYSRLIDKIYIFAENNSLDEIEDTLFHENLHVMFGRSPLVGELYANVKAKNDKADEDLFEHYNSKDVSEELFVSLLAQAMVYGKLNNAAKYLSNESREQLLNTLKDFGYDNEFESERRRRSLSSRSADENQEEPEGTRAMSYSQNEGGRGTETAKEGTDGLRPGNGGLRTEGSGVQGASSKKKRASQSEQLKQLFGRVADMGLDGVLGNKEYVNAMVDMYKVLPEAVQREVADEALSRYGGSIAPAVSDWLNHKAEASVWDKVVAVIREALRKVGFDLDLNTNEAKYILWRSQKPLNRNNLLEVAEDIDMKYRLKVGEYSTNDDGTTPNGGGTPDGGGTKFRASEDVLNQIKQARRDVEKDPSEAQKEAGNYKKGHISLDGFEITLENPKGGGRSGVDKNGKKWSITMNNDYGYIRGTEAVDGDCIDVFLSDNPTEGRVFVVDQLNEEGFFDESKVMYGFDTLNEARDAYLSNYEKGWEKRIMAMTEVSKEEFKKWIDSSHRKTKPFSEYKNVKSNAGGTRFRVKNPTKIDIADERPTIIKEYDKELKTSGFNFQEAFQDRMLSVKVLMEKIEEETGKKARKFEDAYEAENQLSSKNKVDQEKWLDKFYRPLLEELQKLSDKYGLETVRRYVYCKSGLERNVVLRQRDADAAYNEAKEELDEKLAKGDITQAQYDVLLDKAEDQRNKTLSEDIDYSGLRGMLFNVRADELFKQYKEGAITEQEYKQKVDDLKKEKANVIKDWKDFAEVSVSDLESRATSAEIDALWGKINAATNETLRIDFESGMIDRETYEAEKKMMKYYVPLRNWSNTTAEDMYEYRHDMTPAVTSNQKTAKGRESEADNPIATIALMAQNAIVRGNRNKMKMAFYSFVVNRPTALASVRNVWYVRDANNQWQPQYADTSAASSEAEMKQIIEQFENNMKQLEAQGDAFRGKQKIGMNFRASGKQRDEHVVVVMINGKEYAVYVNGNPRAAQAMNGLTNNEAVDDAAKWIDALKRYYGAGLTSWNPDFIIPNLVRDTIHATTMTFLDKGVMASVKYAANVPRMFSHVAKEVSGVSTGDPKLHQYFEEFVANGGETGYTAIHTLEDYKKEYDKLMNEAKGLKGTIGNNTKEVIRKISKVLEAANRIAEDVNRFNAYVTSRESGAGVVESVSVAKNITVNFNRKGALNANHTVYGKVASWMSRWILFFNPSVQGIYQLVTKTKENPKRATALGASILASGFFVPMINDILVSMFGDDDDDYWNQSDYKRRNNWMLFVGNGYISIPLPPVLRELYGIGDIMYGVITGHIPAQRAVYDLLKQVQSAVGFVNVIPEVSQEPDMITYVKGFAPDIVAPFMDVISNSNFMGRPIAKWTDYNESDPEYERVYKGVGKHWVELSKFMNELGGNETRRSANWGNFINPAMMEHLFTSYTGGIGKTINNLAGMIIDAANGDTENMDVFRKTPVLHRFYTPNDEKTVVPGINRKFYEFNYQYNNAKKSLKKSQDAVNSGEHPEWQKYIDEMGKNGEKKFIEYFKKEQKKLKKMQDELKENPNNKELEKKVYDKKAEISAESFKILSGQK